MKHGLTLSLGICFLLQACENANIVVFIPTPYYSHQTAFKPLWLELAKRGHKITLIQSNVIVENNENITHIVLDKTYEHMNKFINQLGEGQSIVSILFAGMKTFSVTMEYQLTHPGVQELLRSKEKVDLFFTEYLSTYGFALGRKLRAPIIGIVSMDARIHSHIAAGNPTHPLMYPDQDSIASAATLKDRVAGSLFWLVFQVVINWFVIPLQEKLSEECLGVTATTAEIVRDNMSLMLINSNPLTDPVRPLGPKTINIGGGVHILEPKPLPKELQDYLDDGKNGVIYFSLGSSITSKQLGKNATEVILRTFSRLPYKVLWKSDEEFADKSTNVKIIKWGPQQDILRHKNIKLFITQGGLQSMEEAIFNYVPMIALPFYGDQYHNTDKMVTKGFGLKLDHKKLDVKSLENAILEVMNNPKYRERTKELADLIKDQPMTGLEKAVWWTEYVLRHGRTDHFRNPAIDMPWYQFLFLDVIAVLLSVVVIFVYVFIKFFQLSKWLVRKLWNSVMKEKKSKTS